MVQDIRRVTLNTDELVQALNAYRTVAGNFLPAGAIDGFDVIDASSINVTLIPKGSTDKKQVVVTDSLLVPVMIRFCIENNIMLPKQGQKSALVAQGGISLCITLDVETYMLGDMDVLGVANHIVDA